MGFEAELGAMNGLGPSGNYDTVHTAIATLDRHPRALHVSGETSFVEVVESGGRLEQGTVEIPWKAVETSPIPRSAYHLNGMDGSCVCSSCKLHHRDFYDFSAHYRDVHFHISPEDQATRPIASNGNLSEEPHYLSSHVDVDVQERDKQTWKSDAETLENAGWEIPGEDSSKKPVAASQVHNASYAVGLIAVSSHAVPPHSALVAVNGGELAGNTPAPGLRNGHIRRTAPTHTSGSSNASLADFPRCNLCRMPLVNLKTVSTFCG